jgi:hypothetical protein
MLTSLDIQELADDAIAVSDDYATECEAVLAQEEDWN